MWQAMIDWVDERFPLKYFWQHHLAQYYAPKNLNFWYFFGGFALLVLANQIITGIWLAMYYTPTAEGAFASIEMIMRDVHYGWLIRYLHSTGASAFFIVLYFHMYRCLIYGSYKKPRELLWLFGMSLYCLLLAEAFTGYVLPWGQMSYWGARVITALFEAIPWIGHGLTELLRGDYNVSGVTLHRFFSFHVILLPLIILSLVGLHVIALHVTGSNNPEGIEIKEHCDADGKPLDGIPFHPYFTVKDLMGIVVFLMVFLGVVFFTPTFGGLFLEPDNFVPANPLVTPQHIAPIWYMTPFYAILRAIPDKLYGVLAMAASIAVLWVLPWLDRSPVRSLRYKGRASKISLSIFVISFIVLGYLGLGEVAPIRTLCARIFSILYFAFFITLPWITSKECTLTVPERVQ